MNELALKQFARGERTRAKLMKDFLWSRIVGLGLEKMVLRTSYDWWKGCGGILPNLNLFGTG